MKRNPIPDGILETKNGLSALRLATGGKPSTAPAPRRKPTKTVGTMYYVSHAHRKALQAEAFRRAQVDETNANASEVLRELLDDVLTDWLARARTRTPARARAKVQP